MDEIQAFIDKNDIAGIQFTEDTKRYYPYGNFAAQVLGFVGTDNNGLYGLESYYDTVLSGTPGRMRRTSTPRSAANFSAVSISSSRIR